MNLVSPHANLSKGRGDARRFTWGGTKIILIRVKRGLSRAMSQQLGKSSRLVLTAIHEFEDVVSRGSEEQPNKETENACAEREDPEPDLAALPCNTFRSINGTCAWC